MLLLLSLLILLLLLLPLLLLLLLFLLLLLLLVVSLLISVTPKTTHLRNQWLLFRPMGNAGHYTHAWMEYSVTKNAAYCFSCRHFGIGCDSAWTKEGYKNWHKGYKEHSEAKKHREGAVAWERYVCNKSKGETVVSQLSTAHAEKQKVTREWLKFVSRVLRFCASQEIASREHRFDGDKTGNFIGAVGLVLHISRNFGTYKQDTSERSIPQSRASERFVALHGRHGTKSYCQQGQASQIWS